MRNESAITLRVAVTALAALVSSQCDAQFGIPGVPSFDRIIRQRSQPQYQQPAPQPQQHADHQKAQVQPTDVADTSTESLWDDAAKRFAVIVGVGSYRNSGRFPNLPNVDTVAARMRTALVDGGFSEENVALLISGSSQGNSAITKTSEPTRRNINSEVSRMLSRATDKDLVMVILVGHGVTVVGQQPGSYEQRGTSYFCPSDTAPQATTSRQWADHSAISIPGLVKQLADHDVGQRVLVVDACQNADAAASLNYDAPEKFREDVWMITSCSKGEVANVDVPAGQSEKYPLFSWYFSEALSWNSPYDDDGDGIVTIREAHRYASDRTFDETIHRGNRQTPRCYAAAGIVPIVQVPALLPGRTLVTGDAELEKTLAARSLARNAGAVIKEGEEHFNKEIVRQLKNQDRLDPELYRNQNIVVGYAFGNYLTRATSLDPNCVDVHLVLARNHRSRGEYALALREYQAAGQQELDVFASGRLPTEDELYTTDQSGNRVVRQDNQHLAQLIGQVPLHTEPREDSRVVRMVQASRNLKVSEVRTETSPSGKTEEWLRVSMVEGDANRMAYPAWIVGSNVHWFKEAAQLYVAGSDLNPDIPSVISSQQRTSEVAYEVAKLSRTQSDLEKAQRTIGILQRFGVPIPGGVNQGLGIAQKVIGIVHAAKVSRGYQAHGNYYVAVQHAEQIKTERLKLLKSQRLDPIEERPVEVDPSPWKLASTMTLQK